MVTVRSWYTLRSSKPLQGRDEKTNSFLVAILRNIHWILSNLWVGLKIRPFFVHVHSLSQTFISATIEKQISALPLQGPLHNLADLTHWTALPAFSIRSNLFFQKEKRLTQLASYCNAISKDLCNIAVLIIPLTGWLHTYTHFMDQLVIPLLTYFFHMFVKACIGFVIPTKYVSMFFSILYTLTFKYIKSLSSVK